MQSLPIATNGETCRNRHSTFREWGSEFGVKPAGKNMDRSPVGVIRGVGDELVIECDARPRVEAVGVISLDDLLRPIIERAVADQYSQPAGGEVGSRLGREALD